MNYSYKTKIEGEVLTVAVTLDRVSQGTVFKVDSSTLINDLKDKYHIVNCSTRLTLISSENEEISGEYTFKIVPKITPSKIKKGKTSE